MKVLYDYQVFTKQKYGGISRVFVDIINSLIKDYKLDVEINCRFSNNYYVDEYRLFKQNKLFENKEFRGKVRLLDAIDKQFSKARLKKGGYDIFHPTHYDPYYLKINKKPTVVMVHDMINEIYPELFSTRNPIPKQKMLSVKYADRIIAISENTKNDILKFYPWVEEEKISVIHHGFNGTDLKAKKIEGIPDQYILFLGQRGLYKNFDIFVKAAAKVLKENEITLVCAGGFEFSEEEKQLFRELNIEQYIKRVVPNDEELNYLYQNAITFVFPSLYEGFGLPLLEALNNNCPLSVSEIGVFKEIVEDAGNYFDPHSIQSIQNSLEKIVNDNEFRKNLIEKGNVQKEKYTIKKTAKKYFELYDQLL